ncbi:hypothetical protein QJS10_CPA06g02036 [Acorus calamus]|uniref:Uncharacterized protein n=1 Tax=Acorus calamus TaxID=4465 RepID=A0AAV9EJF8_ACOCL|nr:hypothetical protein QJS10_CPA06g02036 [Acorus calamus]
MALECLIGNINSRPKRPYIVHQKDQAWKARRIIRGRPNLKRLAGDSFGGVSPKDKRQLDAQDGKVLSRGLKMIRNGGH